MKNKEKSFLTRDIKINSKTGKVLLIIFVFGAFFILGNYHIVLDATDSPFWFIKRPYFGFSDSIANITACTNAPYITVMTNHQSLCRALQNAGYLESEEAREKRIENEFKEEMSQSMNCIDSCDIFDINNYSTCIEGCY